MNKVFLGFGIKSVVVGIFSFFLLGGGLSANIIVTDLVTSQIPYNAINVPYLKIQITSQPESQIIESITLQQTGLSDHNDIDSVRVLGDFGNSSKTSVPSGGEVTLRFYPSLKIPAWEEETLTVIVNMDSQFGRTIGFDLIDIEGTVVMTSEEPETEPLISPRRHPDYGTIRKKLEQKPPVSPIRETSGGKILQY